MILKCLFYSHGLKLQNKSHLYWNQSFSPYLCCKATSPSVKICATSSCVGHSPADTQPNTPHSSPMPDSSNSISSFLKRAIWVCIVSVYLAGHSKHVFRHTAEHAAEDLATQMNKIASFEAQAWEEEKQKSFVGGKKSKFCPTNKRTKSGG